MSELTCVIVSVFPDVTLEVVPLWFVGCCSNGEMPEARLTRQSVPNSKLQFCDQINFVQFLERKHVNISKMYFTKERCKIQ